MTSSEKPEKRRRAKPSAGPKTSASFNPRSKGPTPTEKHDASTRELIERLEKENDRNRETIDRLQEVVNRLSPENARLTADLINADSNSLVSTVLIALGGGAISYATFVVGVAHGVANFGAGLLLAGIILIWWTRANRRSSASKGS